jgi:gamma-D-glutamyl-L-lysine dipeptidyl-peptidase
MKGLILMSTVPMRIEPSDRAEIYGESFEVIDNQEKWSKIKLDHDGYEGWIDNKQWYVTDSVDLNAKPLNKLMLVNKKKSPATVLSMGSLINDKKSLTSPRRILASARQFLGVPYLWGGRTFMGIDCSGLTQVVFRVHGKNIPRDAWQQAETGKRVQFGKIKDGDLAFFKNDAGKVVHVGILFREDGLLKIIHASGQVRIDRLDEQGIFNDDLKKYTHTLHSVKRIRR